MKLTCHSAVLKMSLVKSLVSARLPSGFPGGAVVENPLAVQETRRREFNPWVVKIP